MVVLPKLVSQAGDRLCNLAPPSDCVSAPQSPVASPFSYTYSYSAGSSFPSNLPPVCLTNTNTHTIIIIIIFAIVVVYTKQRLKLVWKEAAFV